MTGDPFTVDITSAEDQIRLDVVVSQFLDNCSRSFAANLIRDGFITVDGHLKKPGYRVKANEVLSISLPPPKPSSFKAEPLPIDIIYDDNDILVLNKPPGLVVHPAPGHESGTLVNGLLYQYPFLSGIGGEQRPGIVHRLDKDTSGIMVVAKNQAAHVFLSEAFKERRVQKHYLALVCGNMETQSGEVVLPIGRHPQDRKKMSVKSAKGRMAKTQWTVKETFKGVSLLRLRLHTGRTHQIRVHCLAIHHPIIGDPVYGCRKMPLDIKDNSQVYACVRQAKRQMLHAEALSFTHPVTGTLLTFNAPLPADMRKMVGGLSAVNDVNAVNAHQISGIE